MSLSAEAVEGFVGSVLAKRYDESTASPEFHRELWQLACSDYKYVAIAAPRGHAKSTAGTMAYGLAMLLFRQAKFMVIVSDTESQAVMFLQNMKQEILENELIRELFGLKLNLKGEVLLEKDSESDFIVPFDDGRKFRVIAKGAEQRLRGMNWENTRPDLIICDDLENDELVMNKERRTKLRRWFFSALMPMMSPRGKLRMWGTILHMDSLLETLMPDEWKKSCIDEGLKIYDPTQKGLWKSVKYRAHTPDFKQILWPQRFDKSFFVDKRDEAVRQGIPDTYSQEYLNHPIDESVAYFKKKDFQAIRKDWEDLNLTYYITADLAISEKETADYSVFLVAGVDENRRLHVKNVIRERLDGREIVDMILHLHRAYEPAVFGIEEMQVTKAIGPFLREEMISQGVFPNILLLKHGGKDKIMRAKSIQARMRARSVYFDEEEDWYPTFEDECLKFPRSKHDDQVDAFAYMGLLLDKVVEGPTNLELLEEEYEEELERSNWRNNGRSRTTGY